MKCRVRRRKGFEPINVRLRFDNIVEYDCFRTLMGDYETTPYAISVRLTGLIPTVSGVSLSEREVEQCLKSMMIRIWNKMPEGREDRQ